MMGDPTEAEKKKALEENYAMLAKKYFGDLDKKCRSNNVQLAIAVVVDETMPDMPLIYKIGDTYSQAVLTSRLLTKLKNQLNKEL